MTAKPQSNPSPARARRQNVPIGRPFTPPAHPPAPQPRGPVVLPRWKLVVALTGIAVVGFLLGALALPGRRALQSVATPAPPAVAEKEPEPPAQPEPTRPQPEPKPQPEQPARPKPSAAPPARTPEELGERIDRLVAERWQEAGVRAPAAAADDATFLRRVSLDLLGHIPSAGEARAFLNDRSAGKRDQLVERLLRSPRHPVHFARLWRELLIPEAPTSQPLEEWLRQRFAWNTRFDDVVRQLLTAPVNDGGPLAGFFAVKGYRPENLAAATGRLFLGVKLECAECHDHPFAKWKREQFWGLAAFFAGVAGRNQGERILAPAAENPERKAIKIPGTSQVVWATFPDGAEAPWDPATGGRQALAEWVTKPDNPFFARAVANRLWGHFFGLGLVDPVDDFGDENRPSHPELLDELARALTANDFDLRFLMRAIAGSRAYQLSSRAGPGAADDLRLFTRMPIRGLTAEQFCDSLAQATGGAGLRRRAEFLAQFKAPGDRPTETGTSILQALALMNGSLAADVTSPEQNGLLRAILDAPFLDTTSRIETLFLATLTRRPRDAELERLVRYVGEAGQADRPEDEAKALGDVLWVLLNTTEFAVNH